jgi:hypothetical protein
MMLETLVLDPVSNMDSVPLAITEWGAILGEALNMGDLCHPVARSAYLWWIEACVECWFVPGYPRSVYELCGQFAASFRDASLCRLTLETLHLCAESDFCKARAKALLSSRKRRKRPNKKKAIKPAAAAAAPVVEGEEEEEEEGKAENGGGGDDSQLVQDLLQRIEHLSLTVTTREQELSRMSRTLDEAQDRGKCSICLDKASTRILLPCRHLCSCGECGHQLRACPICRTLVTDHLGVHLV